MTREILVMIAGALAMIVGTATMIRPAVAETARASCETESVAARLGELDCWTGQDGQVTVFSTRSQAHAQRLASVANETLETSGVLLPATTVRIERLEIVAWPADHSNPLAARPELLEGESLYLMAGDESNDVRDAISDIVIDRAAFPHQSEVPLWLRIALRHWVRGGNQSATLDPARKIATDPTYAYDEYFPLERLESWPTLDVFQRIYVAQSLAMLAWLLQDWPPEAFAGMFTRIAEGDSFEQSVLDTYELSSDSFVSAFAAEAPRITQLSWPYTERPPWHAWFTTGKIIALSIAALALLVLAQFWRWLRRPVDVPRQRSGIPLRRYMPRSGSFRF